MVTHPTIGDVLGVDRWEETMWETGIEDESSLEATICGK